MELIDTVGDMISNDYEKRFIAEYNQLKIRKEKLSNMIDKYTHNELDFEPVTPIETLIDQWVCMTKYLSILSTRAMMEGINLC